MGVLGALRLAYVAFLSGTRAVGPDAAALEPWRHGYLLHDPYAVVRASTTLPERLAWVFLYAIVGGFTVYLLVSFFARSLRHADARYPGDRGHRWSTVLLLRNGRGVVVATAGSLAGPRSTGVEGVPARFASRRPHPAMDRPGARTAFRRVAESTWREGAGRGGRFDRSGSLRHLCSAAWPKRDPMLDEAAAQRGIGAPCPGGRRALIALDPLAPAP
ncbi:MAG: hypothetical protein IPI41_20030 [Flavobacteriales bacterium]|nr:hypothetical protein [Flavobacteriales bacterium]